jgi:AraC-like DNA-binding protein
MTIRAANPDMRTQASASRGYILAAWIKAIGRALEAAGCDSGALLAEAGFDLKSLDGPTLLCPLANAARLWEISVAATGDPAFGVKVASHIRHTTFHVLSYGLCASSTLKDAFERLQRYCHVASDAVEYEFRRCGDDYHFLIEPAKGVPFESIDALVGAQLRMCRSLIGRDFSPRQIELRRPRPSIIDDFERLFRAPLRFSAAQNRLIFDSFSVEAPLDGANPDLALRADAIALQYLARIERDNIQARVREVLMQRLQCAEPSQEEVAEQLCMSARTLQRKLGESGTTYKEILDETRRSLALIYLSAPHHSVSEITYLLGFSSGSSFTRAFRRWTGQSPSTWRAGSVAQ